jgi:hypothetical protein
MLPLNPLDVRCPLSEVRSRSRAADASDMGGCRTPHHPDGDCYLLDKPESIAAAIEEAACPVIQAHRSLDPSAEGGQSDHNSLFPTDSGRIPVL